MKNPPIKPRRQFDETFKREAVAHWLSSGKSAQTIGEEMDIHPSQLNSWKRRFVPAQAGGRAVAGTKPGSPGDLQSQLDAAQREIRHLREQRDILKKTLGILSEPPSNGTKGSMR